MEDTPSRGQHLRPHLERVGSCCSGGCVGRRTGFHPARQVYRFKPGVYTEPLEEPFGSMALLTVHFAIAIENLSDPIEVRIDLA